MKQFFKSLWTVAALATVFAGCSKDEAESPANKPREISMSVIAGSELETSPESRTTLNDDNSISWETSGEFLRVFETAGETTSSSKSEEALIDAGKAVFNVSFTENTSATAFTYNAVYPESAWVTSNNTDANNMKLITPTNQLPTATSFDGDADLLIAYPEQRDAQPTELQVRFKRIVAVGKMTLKNLNSTEAITSVEFIAPENKNVTGRSYVNLNEGTVTEYGYSDMHYNNVVMNYDASLEMQSGMTAYFTCFPFEILAGETFKVVVTTPSKVFTREVTIPDGRSLAFTEGRASVFSVDMSAATEEALETLEGEYVAIVKQGTTYYALASTNTNSSTRLDAKEVAYNGTDQTINVNDPTLVWTIAKSGDNYTLSNNNMFVSYSGSSNTAEMSDTEYLLNISKTGDGLYTIGSVSKTDRMLEKNKSSKYFAFYTGTQDGDFYLVKFDGEAQVPTATPIGEITTEGNYTAEGTVVARGSQAYIIADNTGAMMVYHKDNERSVGEKISISGEVTLYNAQSTPQFSASATVEVLSSDNKWTYNPTKMDGAAMDALLSASPVCKEIEFEGNLVVDGNYVNVTIPGASTAIGSVKYIDNSTISQFNGKDVVVKGYFVGTSSSKFVNVLPYSIEEAGGSTDPNPDPEVTPIGEITAAGDYKAEGTVVACGKQAYIIADNTGAMMVYHYDSGRTVGEKISISGAVTVYANESGTSKGTPQFSDNATVEVLSTGNDWAYQPTVLDGAGMDAILTGELVCKEIQFEGNLEISGNYMNVTIPGASTAIGSIKYVETSTVEAYNGKDIIVKGYYVGYSSNMYVNVLPYSVEEANPSTDPAIKADPTSLSFAAAGERKEVTYTAENLGSNQVFAAISGDGAAQFTASVGNGTVTVTAAENTETTAKTATLTLYIAASEGGEHLDEETVALTQAGVSSGEGLEPGTILYEETFGTTAVSPFSSYTGTGSSTYENASILTYTCKSNNTKIMADEQQACDVANLMVGGKKGGAGEWAKIGGIKTYNATSVTVTWTANNAKTTVSIEESSSAAVESANSESNTATFALNGTEETITLVITTPTKDNGRVDSFKIVYNN